MKAVGDFVFISSAESIAETIFFVFFFVFISSAGYQIFHDLFHVRVSGSRKVLETKICVGLLVKCSHDQLTDIDGLYFSLFARWRLLVESKGLEANRLSRTIETHTHPSRALHPRLLELLPRYIKRCPGFTLTAIQCNTSIRISTDARPALYMVM